MAAVAATARNAAGAVAGTGRAFRLAVCVAIACLPSILGRGTISRVAGLHELAAASPYFHPEFAGILYLWTPLVAVSSFLFFLSPGIFLVTAFGNPKALFERILLGFGASLVCTIVLETGLKLVLGTPLRDEVYIGSWGAASLLSALLLLWRTASGRAARLEPAFRLERRRILWIAGMALAGTAILTPKIFWENFNIDGTEAFEFGRSLGRHILPNWDIQGGAFGFYHNFVLFAYPNHWFIALFGPFEASVRLPYLFYVGLLFAALVLIIEHGSVRRLTIAEEAALWAGLVAFSIVQVYNTTYDPFFCDMAEPGATDSLMIVCFLAGSYFLWTDRLRYFVPFALLTYLSTVGGSALLAALGFTVVLGAAPRKREYLKAFVALGCACAGFGILHETLYNHLVLNGAKDQFSTRNMAARLFPPTLTEFRRLGAVIFPSGILPVFSVLAVRPSDWIGWSAGAITVLYAGVIYLQSWTALHQFTPAMVVPLIVFWRVHLRVGARARTWLLSGILAATAACAVLSLPRSFRINQAAREFGAATAFEVGDYEGGYESAVRAAGILYTLLPADYRVRYPNQTWGMDDETWLYYAMRPKPPGAEVNYIVRTSSAPAPAQTMQVGSRDDISVFVRDPQLWARQRNRELPKVIQSPLYEPIMNRTCLFFRDYIARQQLKARQGK